MSRSLILVGNYGAGNIGDEALKEYFLRTFPDISWTVISAHPVESHEVPRLPMGLKSFFRPWWRTIVVFWRADAVVFGGGSLFTDTESIFACVLWGIHAFVALFFRKPTLFAFQGVGPFRSSFAEIISRIIFVKATFISVRDAKSLERVSGWAPVGSPLLTFDPAFAYFKTFIGSLDPPASLALIPRSNSGDSFFRTVTQELLHFPGDVKILLMQPDPTEKNIAKKLLEMCPRASLVEIVSVSHLLEEIFSSSAVVSQRYHGALAALALGRRTVICPQRDNDKLDELRKAVEMPGEIEKFQDLIKVGESAFKDALTVIGCAKI